MKTYKVQTSACYVGTSPPVVDVVGDKHIVTSAGHLEIINKCQTAAVFSNWGHFTIEETSSEPAAA